MTKERTGLREKHWDPSETSLFSLSRGIVRAGVIFIQTFFSVGHDS